MWAQLFGSWIRLYQSPVTCEWDFGPLGPDSRAGGLSPTWGSVPKPAKAQATDAGLQLPLAPCTRLLQTAARRPWVNAAGATSLGG